MLAEVSTSQLIAHQLTWSQDVSGENGKCTMDLKMEHLNRVVKDHVANLGANVAESLSGTYGDLCKF